MPALSSENPPQDHLHAPHRTLDVDCILFLIILGKILLNILTLGMRSKSTNQNFMGYFCISLALTDLFLLVNISIISYLRDFVFLGIRFTKYHICLLTQVASLTYGLLHYPVFLIAYVDYCFHFCKSAKQSSKCRRLFYWSIVILIWISVLAYVLGDPDVYQSLGAHGVSYQCPSYVSSQSYWLSVSMMMVLCGAFITSWSEVLALIQAVRVTSYMNKTILYFPFSPHCSHTGNSKKTLASKLSVCFLGTWSPFVLLQAAMLFLNVQMPAYMEMNVPWLYFVNSFLIATVCWFNCHEVYLKDSEFPVDPFVNWKCCFIPLMIHHLEQTEKPISVIIC